MSLGTPIGCSECGHLSCVCGILERHRDGCPYRRAATGSVGIECDHGFDVCIICDQCTCPDISVAVVNGRFAEVLTVRSERT